MKPEVETSQAGRSSELARMSLLAAAILMIAGSLYGLLVAGPRGLLTAFEWISLPPVILVGIAIIVVLRMYGPSMVRRVGLFTSFALSLHVTGNLANAVFLSDDPFKIYLHSVWVLPLILLIYAVNRRRVAMILSLAVTLSVIGVIIGTILGGRAGELPPSYLDSQVTLLIAMLMTLVLLYNISFWLESMAAEQMRANLLAARSAELDDLAARLMASEERSRTMLEQSPDVICNIDAEGRFIMVSSRARELFGVEPETLSGAEFASLIHPDDRAFAEARLGAVLAGTPTANLELRVIRPDGAIVRTVWSAVWSAPSGSVYAVARDLAERLAAEERARRSERLIAIGQLTSGVAHDFNNLLTVILGNAEMLLEHVRDSDRLTAMGRLIRDSAMRGAELTNRLLAFSRSQNLEPQAILVSRLVTEFEELLRRTLGEGIELICLHQPGQWLAKVDPVQLGAALVNLCVNARDAMPDGGRLTIETSNATLDETSAGSNPEVAAGDYVMVHVADTGSGMSPDVLARVFEPFFTTKEVGKGTGLGLSMVYGFVRQSGGHVQVCSESGEGTQVRLYLPRASASERGAGAG